MTGFPGAPFSVMLHVTALDIVLDGVLVGPWSISTVSCRRLLDGRMLVVDNGAGPFGVKRVGAEGVLAGREQLWYVWREGSSRWCAQVRRVATGHDCWG